MSSKPLFPDFSALSANVFYLDPPEPPKPVPPKLSASYVIIPPNKNDPPPPAPDLVILCAWMNAAPKHIQKYIAGYRALYPTTKMLAITSDTADFFTRSRSTQLARLSPVLDILAGKKKVLLHLFSNGGAQNARVIASLYRSKYSASLPVCGMIFDSAPGGESYGAFVRAFSAGFSPAKMPYPLYLLAMAGIHVLFVLYFLAHWFTVLVQYATVQKPVTFLQQLRSDLNDYKFFDKSVPRAYIFSDKDVMVEEYAVLEHIKEAKKAGYDLREEKFMGSSHVGHLVGDPKRYWIIVDTVFKDGIAKK